MTREPAKSVERMTRDELADVLRGADFRGLGADFGDACERLADAVRALPVIATCGKCGWCDYPMEGASLGLVCLHPKSKIRFVDESDAPPSACPLRGKR